MGVEIIVAIISAALISNVVLSRFLGICAFLGVSNKVDTAKGMGVAVIFVILMATAVTYVINRVFLEATGVFKRDLTYLQTIAFILVIAALVQFLEMFLKKFIPSLYKALGIYLPLITTNCAVLGVALTVAQDYSNFVIGMAYALGTSGGFCISIILLASIREKLENNDIPESFKGKPIVLVMACLMAIAFTGFSNLNIG
ncbi:MAG: electron transport complex subunit RsxA [Lachnospiraceae bacterium]|nr:electron transport complex subunit RsxA [Lachnospiraceae bacterium]MBR1844486.1 electron transport complex subunit RsxA [Lachnospiraceae bacterium]